MTQPARQVAPKAAPPELSWRRTSWVRREGYQRILDFLADRYFRAKLVCQDLPLANGSEEPVIFAGNHSGMAFPWEALIFQNQLTRFAPRRLPMCAMIAPALMRSPIMQLFGVPNFWQHFGVDATSKNFDEAAASEFSVLIFPEGIAGIGKGFHRRYQLQKFATSTVRVALRTGRPIVPVYTVNGEYLNPLAYQIGWLSKLAQKIGIPFLPIGLMTPVYLLLPPIYFSVLPAQLTYVLGARIDVRAWFDGNPDSATEADIKNLTARLQVRMQTDLSRAVQEHGRKPFAWGSFLRSIAGGPRRLLLLPLAWPFLFQAASLRPDSTLAQKFRAVLACASLSLPLIGWPLFFATFLLGKARPKTTPVAFPPPQN